MARVLAIDYGTKRTGLAVTDPLQIIATALTTVRSFELIDYLTKYFTTEKVEKVVIGQPKTLMNIASENQKYIDIFLKHFAKAFPNMPYEFIDERFTSTIAHQTVLQGGVKKKNRENKEMIDQISATIILQSYLEQKNNRL